MNILPFRELAAIKSQEARLEWLVALEMRPRDYDKLIRIEQTYVALWRLANPPRLKLNEKAGQR